MGLGVQTREKSCKQFVFIMDLRRRLLRTDSQRPSLVQYQKSRNKPCLEIPSDPSSGRKSIDTTIDTNYANAINQPIAFITGKILALLRNLATVRLQGQHLPPQLCDFEKEPPLLGIAGVVATDGDARRQRAKLISTVLAGVVTDNLARNIGDGSFPYSVPFFLLPNLILMDCFKADCLHERNWLP